jgi:small subunit ribosomal protein S6
MFLIDSALASDDWDGMLKNIENLLKRYEAEIESIKKWDSRSLAYRIKGKTHGTYILTYFRIDGTKISPLERDVQLSENIMRVMILRTDRMSAEDIEKLTPTDKVEAREREIAERVAKQKAQVPETEDIPSDDKVEAKQTQQQMVAEDTLTEDQAGAEETQLELDNSDITSEESSDTPPPLQEDQTQQQTEEQSKEDEEKIKE